jgi:hypothetical protein
MTDRNLRKQAEESGGVLPEAAQDGCLPGGGARKAWVLAAESAPLAEELALQPVEPPRRKRSTSALLPVTALRCIILLQQETGARLVVLFKYCRRRDPVLQANRRGTLPFNGGHRCWLHCAQASPLAVAAGGIQRRGFAFSQ